MTENIFKGIITALITPFKNGEIDFIALEKLIEGQIEASIDAIVIGGSTGEGNSLSNDTYYALIDYAVKIVRNRLPLIAGMSAISTESAIEKVLKLSTLSLQGIMCTPPHYIKPTQSGIYEHFKHIHDNSSLPIILYIHAGRTGVDLTDETIIKLAKLEKITALKDADEDIERPLRLLNKLPYDFRLLSGNDSNLVAYNAHGGSGCISVAANIVPQLCKELQAKWQQGDLLSALKLQQALLPLYTALSLESNPIGVKYAAYCLNLCSEDLKLPLTPAVPETRRQIDKALSILL